MRTFTEEQIKKIKKNVDVLTLSATPIPRTLNMSMTGIKDMSVIEEPPEERYPVQTYVLEQDDLLIKDIIEDHFGDLCAHFSELDVLTLDLAVDLLLFVGQKYISFAVFLDKRLAHKAFQSVLHAARQIHAILINIGDHQARDVVDVRRDFFDVFNHEQRL